MSIVETAARVAANVTLALAGYPEDKRANIVEAVVSTIGKDDPLSAAEARLREIEGDSGIPLNMRGAGSQP